MKHLKSTHGDLHRIFTLSITVREIAEPLVTFDREHPADKVKQLMESKEFDVVGVLERGTVSGFAQRVQLGDGPLGKFMSPFNDRDVVDESEPLLTALKALQSSRWLFVRFLGQPSGIVTRGDLQKAPIRMWIFGLITLFEMQMLRCIRKVHPDETWKSFLSSESLSKADEKLRKLRSRNEETYLDDCLSLDDKARIFKQSKTLLQLTDAQNGVDWWDFACRLRNLRNDLAHAGDFFPENWSKLSSDVDRLEKLLVRLESSR
jgi:hypothetical protein